MWRLLILSFLAVASAELAFSQAPANCPTISVTGPKGIVQPGEKFLFTGAVEGDVPKNVSFHWEVAGGKIVEGQGTLKLSADADWSPGGGATITATLNIVGLPEECPKSASVTGGLDVHPIPLLIDEFGRQTNGSIKARLDSSLAELRNNRNNQGYIIVYGTDREMAARERLIINHIKIRAFPRDRMTIVRGGVHPEGTVYTKLYRVPPGAENPAP